MENVLKKDLSIEMEIGEDRVKVLHDWISDLCDPETNFSSSLMQHFHMVCQPSTAGDGETDKTKDLEKMGFNSDPSPLFTDFQESAGAVVYKSVEGSMFEGHYTNGRPNGYFRKINSDGDIDLFACFVQGSLHGNCWKGLTGGGFLVSNSTEFSGSTTMYLYPDCRTVLYGNFYKGQMVQGRLCNIIGAAGHCSSSCGMLKPVLTPPSGQVYSYDPSTSIRICSEPLLPDPYEAEFVKVGESTVPGAGEGLFARTDIEVGTVISFYNGIRIPPLEGIDSHDLRDYRISLDDDLELDIPLDMISTSEYCATLSHKVKTVGES
ncbi:histone-lysine N-methyltransferase SETD7 [Eurytemora carolleeae]|uniref:histone-lysine N-methyltransferase SETD7 n=1 Tax=Eurytemora carolleeae TaxID=1294199 RepID=UPI000C7811EC|nr:histone-lysine N-methyltransferase SETD7 [Eurytemora carolleeae]|eukprot:XP_023322597.1 histone-lysine N-methyltransferase SETD7-like [Eurytemora affinis]